jgi:transposase-like protein
MNITDDEALTHKFADLLTHRCGFREEAIERDGMAMWRCWTCGNTRLPKAGSDASNWFQDKANRAANAMLRARGF